LPAKRPAALRGRGRPPKDTVLDSLLNPEATQQKDDKLSFMAQPVDPVKSQEEVTKPTIGHGLNVLADRIDFRN